MPNASIPRHALSVLILPFTVTVLIPVWIGRTSDTVLTAPASPAAWLAVVTGALALAAGLLLLSACIGRFGSEGRGTLAPWDPPRELVVGGPYAFRLRRRFGRAYAEYEEAVPRLVPRLRPWRPEGSADRCAASP